MDDLPEIKKSLHGDDLFLKKKELAAKIEVSHVPHSKAQDYAALNCSFTEGALSYDGRNMTRNDEIVKAIGLDSLLERL